MSLLLHAVTGSCTEKRNERLLPRNLKWIAFSVYIKQNRLFVETHNHNHAHYVATCSMHPKSSFNFSWSSCPTQTNSLCGCILQIPASFLYTFPHKLSLTKFIFERTLISAALTPTYSLTPEKYTIQFYSTQALLPSRSMPYMYVCLFRKYDKS